ncbi:TonB-dependent receptor [Segetibacter sp. 3557_3]|uniref:TonB-dependent receptor n=1 Tax=Segetibacter sp. 3557_3 TaxID=2547429 RepID=UPI00105901DF|nr:TonB-dependent receptor [Segetibacter sp. 3557_3]TDH28519.1 TonB-dependent receptor [Segetibacter sp. 3557_3]
MKKGGLVCLLLVMYCTALSQIKPGRITGKVFSDSGYIPIEGASVSLQNNRDSLVDKIVLSDKKGAFVFTDTRPDEYLLLISVINHVPFQKKISLPNTGGELQLDSLILKFTSDSLASVTVVGYRTPVKILGDTTEYNAAAFKTKENAMVEDLLRKLPGLEVTKDGTIKSNGEQITRILVDGQPFFSDDPKLATQNLPRNIIDKIQVIDEKSDQARLTKVDDGIRNKVINIVIKKDKRKGTFGRAYVGRGTSKTYEAKLNANAFNGDKKYSLIAGGNNTGRSDYGGGDNERASYNNFGGIAKDAQVRMNYINKWGKHMNVSANVGYNTNRSTAIQSRNRQNIFGDSSTWYQETSQSIRYRNGISTGISIDYKPDTLTSIRLNASANLGKSRFSSGAVFSSTLPQAKKINEGNRENRGESGSPSVNGNISVNRRFKKSRRAVFLQMSNNRNSSINDNFNTSNNYFYPTNLPEYKRLLNQYNQTNNKSSSTNTSLSYSEPIGTKGSLSVNTAYNFSKNNNQRELFDYNIQSGLYDIFNDTLSSNFDNYNLNASLGASYAHNLKKGSISVGSSWQSSRSKSVSLTRDSVYRQHFSSLVPYISFNRHSNGKSFNLYYNFSSNAPQAYQLQPVLDNSNPLFLRLGNPNLRFSSTHRVNGGLNLYNSKNNRSIYFNGNFSVIQNAFSTSTIYDKLTGSQVTQPINVSGVYNGGGNVSFNQPFKLWAQNIRWNVSNNFNLNRNVSIIDYQQNVNFSIYTNWSTGLDVDVEDWLQLGINYNYNIQNTRYSLRPNMNNSSATSGGSVRGEVTPGKLTEIRFDWNFSSNTGRSAGFNQTINLVNADLTQYFSTRKNFWVTLRVYDLLKENVNIYRRSGENFIEDTRMNVLTRFFLLSANMRLNKFGGRTKRSE